MGIVKPHQIMKFKCLPPPPPPNRGRSPVKPEEVMWYYGGTHVPMHVMESAPSGSKWKLTQFLDNFSIPEATLFADVLEVHVYSDVYCYVSDCE